MEYQVCVIIAARNAQETIAAAVASALAQDHVSEVIVVDDASTDNTALAAGAADDGSGRLKILAEKTNLGPAGARNRALGLSAAPYFCVLDADDYMLPGRLSRLLPSARGPWDLIADDMIILPQEARLSFSLHRENHEGRVREIDLESFVTGNISRPGRPRGELGFLKPVVSRQFMRTHGLLYDETIRLGEDYAFYVKALLHGARFQLVSACGYVAVERQDSLSSRHCAQDLRRIVLFDDAVLAQFPTLAGDGRRALIRHRNATWNKFAYAAALETKKRHGLAAGLASLARMPAALPYVLGETLRAKAKTLRRRFDGRSVPEQRGLRFLIGLPEARLADVRPIPSMRTDEEMSAIPR